MLFFQDILRRSITATSVEATSRQVTIRPGDPEQTEALTGGVELAVSSLLSPDYLAEWGPVGTPLEAPTLLDRARQL
ncbi:MAG: hypothetical protein KDB60_11475 [Propionibacteriaceae bacterium]|nr:hypothetical protein [Propionibacteriaceae bacterium]